MDSWLRRWSTPLFPRSRLLALPPAGGAAHLFQPWARYLPLDTELVAVEPAGHGTRLAEQPVSSMTELVDRLAAEVRALPPVPTAVLGHSMGAIVALALCRRLRRLDPAWRPIALFVVGSEARSSRRTARELAQAAPQRLRDFLATAHAGTGSGGTDPALQDLVLPALRADLALLADFQPVPEPPLGRPVRVLAGADDPFVTAADRQDWAAEGDDYAVSLFPGGHFFYQHEAVARQVVEQIVEDLRRLQAQPRN